MVQETTTEGDNGLSIADAGAREPCPANFNIAAHVLAPASRTPDKTALLVLDDSASGVAENWSFGALDHTIRSTA
ncbi:MAG: hypothetical protein AAFV62_11685, partial [Pseudomonadota bacterium]